MLTRRQRRLLDAIVAQVPPVLDRLFRPIAVRLGEWGACTTYSRMLAEVLSEFEIHAEVASVYVFTANKAYYDYRSGKIDLEEAKRRGGRVQWWGDIRQGQKYQHAVCYIPGWDAVVDLAIRRSGSRLVPCHPYWAVRGERETFPWWVLKFELRIYNLEYRVYETQPDRVKRGKEAIRQVVRRYVEMRQAELRIDRLDTTNRICSNLVGAGILLPAEVDRYKALLETYDLMTLMRVLVISRQLREARAERRVEHQESEDQLYVDYTYNLLLEHLLLSEDHFLKYAEKPDEQCRSCLYWHGRKLQAYTSLECPKFEGANLELCNQVYTFASRFSDGAFLENLDKETALAMAREARDLRYKIAAPEEQPTLEQARVLCEGPCEDIEKKLADTGQVYLPEIDMPLSVTKGLFLMLDTKRKAVAKAHGVPEVQYDFEDLLFRLLSRDPPEQQTGLEQAQGMMIIDGEEVPPEFRDLIPFIDEPLPEYSFGGVELTAVEPEVAERKIDAVLRQLKNGVESIQESGQFRQFLVAMSRFHHYSIGNQILIALQKPEATRVAGYVTWHDLGRWVKKGEKGISILAPVIPARESVWERRDGTQWTIRRTDRKWGIYITRTPEGQQINTFLEDFDNKWEAERRVREDWGGRRVSVEEPRPYEAHHFKVVYVFDISQTEGEPLPEFEVPVLTGEVNEELFDKLLDLSRRRGVSVSFESRPELSPDIKGQYIPPDQVWVRPEEARAQQLKSLTHEIAHYYSEGVFSIPRRDAEVIAESAAFVIGAHYGFDTGVRSFPYVARWAEDKEVLEQNLEAIRRTATAILEGLEPGTEIPSASEEEQSMIKHKVSISMSKGEAEALRDRLVPITPLDYSTEAYAFLRNLYGRLDGLILDIERPWKEKEVKKVTISMSIEEAEALRDRLVPITPVKYSLKAFTFLRNLYGRLDHLVSEWKEKELRLEENLLTPLDEAVREAREIIDRKGTAEVEDIEAVARKTGIPYTTLVDQAIDFETKPIDDTYRLVTPGGKEMGTVISKEEYEADPDFANKLERGVLKVKAKLPKWCLEEKAWGQTREGQTCYNPYAVVRASIRAASGLPIEKPYVTLALLACDEE